MRGEYPSYRHPSHSLPLSHNHPIYTSLPSPSLTSPTAKPYELTGKPDPHITPLTIPATHSYPSPSSSSSHHLHLSDTMTTSDLHPSQPYLTHLNSPQPSHLHKPPTVTYLISHTSYISRSLMSPPHQHLILLNLSFFIYLTQSSSPISPHHTGEGG